MMRRILGVPMRGGHGHGHVGQATLYGEPPVAAGSFRKAQIWEPYHNVFLAGTALIAAGMYYRRNTNPHDWARDEAEERLRRKEAGEEVKYGVNYAGIRYMKENGMVSAEEAARLEGGEVVPPVARQLTSPKSGMQ